MCVATVNTTVSNLILPSGSQSICRNPNNGEGSKMDRVEQNRRQKVFSRGLCSSGGALHLRGGLDIIKLTKIPLIFSVSRFNFGGLGDSLGGISPPGDGTGAEVNQTWVVYFQLYLCMSLSVCSEGYLRKG